MKKSKIHYFLKKGEQKEHYFIVNCKGIKTIKDVKKLERELHKKIDEKL